MVRQNKRKLILHTTLIVLPVLIISFLSIYRHYDIFEYKDINIQSVISLAKNDEAMSSDVFNKKKVFLFIDLADFSCLPCENGVVYLCRSLGKDQSNEDVFVMLFVKKGKGRIEYYENFMINWEKENEIKFPFIVDTASIFAKIGVKKTSVFLIDNDDNLIRYEKFPLSISYLNELLDEVR